MLQFGRIDPHHTTAKTLTIRKADMGADVDASRHCEFDGTLHDHGIAGVKSTRQIGRRQHVEQGFVVAHAPGAKTLGEVGIDVNIHSRSRVLWRKVR